MLYVLKSGKVYKVDNFTVPDVNKHPYEQMPIKDDFKVEQILLYPAENKNVKIENDDKF